jgi:AcrR family transcriptional regulator
MSASAEPFSNPETSKEEILHATYLAFAEHGYAELSIQQIADQASVSKSTIYHHFEDKEELLMVFAERLLEWYLEELLFDPAGDPIENLERSLDLVFLDETAEGFGLDDIRPAGFECVYMGLRMEATRNPEIRDYFDAVDSMGREHLETLVERGIENGTVRPDVDAEQVAAALCAIAEGGLVLRSTENDIAWLRHVRAMLDGYLDSLKVDPDATGA